MMKKHLARLETQDDGTKKLTFIQPQGFKEDLKLFKDGRVWITIENYKPTRSQASNNVLHWYCKELADYLGIEPKEFKEMMKLKFLIRPKVNNDGEEMVDMETGEMLMYVPSTSKLNTEEMMIFTDKIRVWAMDFLKYVLPLPDKNYKLFKNLEE